MRRIFKELYGVGILFFYYMKFVILFGWPFLRYVLEYRDNIIMNVLWVFCLFLFIKDLVDRFILKKDYCTDASLHHTTQNSRDKMES